MECLGCCFAVIHTKSAPYAGFFIERREIVLHLDSLNIRGAIHHARVTKNTIGIEACVVLQPDFAYGFDVSAVRHAQGI